MTKLDNLHPALVERITRVLSAMETLGFPMRIVQAVRTTAEQQTLYAQGRTTPGNIVTNCDGVKSKSNHQIKADGYGHAVDCAFVVGGVVSFADTLPWSTYGACAKALGLAWGGDFKSLLDRPHVELP